MTYTKMDIFLIYTHMWIDNCSTEIQTHSTFEWTLYGCLLLLLFFGMNQQHK